MTTRNNTKRRCIFVTLNCFDEIVENLLLIAPFDLLVKYYAVIEVAKQGIHCCTLYITLIMLL